MDYQLKTYNSLSEIEKVQFEVYCHQQSKLDDRAAENMSIDFEGGIISIIKNTSRFDGKNGEFFILFIDDNIAACSGVYTSEFSKLVALAGVRTWTTKKYRNLQLHRNILLPAEKAWAIKNNLKIVALSFNDYNKNLMVAPYRSRAGEGPIRRTKKHLFFSNLNRVEFPVNIQNTKQWVLYEKIDPNWEFDWKSIEYVFST
jgi:hypothetical protein